MIQLLHLQPINQYWFIQLNTLNPHKYITISNINHFPLLINLVTISSPLTTTYSPIDDPHKIPPWTGFFISSYLINIYLFQIHTLPSIENVYNLLPNIALPVITELCPPIVYLTTLTPYSVSYIILILPQASPIKHLVCCYLNKDKVVILKVFNVTI